MALPRIIAAAALAVALVSGAASARPLREFSFEQLFSRANLVVIAQPEAKTHDTGEVTTFPGIGTQDANCDMQPVPAYGVETPFLVIRTLRGDARLHRFVLHHYREATPPPSALGPIAEVIVVGANVVAFDPNDHDQPHAFLLFLVREKDGRYAPVGDMTDPGMQSVFALDPATFHVPQDSSP
jgi:hypothetical protein